MYEGLVRNFHGFFESGYIGHRVFWSRNGRKRRNDKQARDAKYTSLLLPLGLNPLCDFQLSILMDKLVSSKMKKNLKNGDNWSVGVKDFVSQNFQENFELGNVFQSYEAFSYIIY